MDRLTKVLLESFEAIARADELAVNDAAFRKQYKIIANTPAMLNALARARDAPMTKKQKTTKPDE